MSRKITEILTGLAVIVVAAAFLAFALGKTGSGGGGGGSYPLFARFSAIGGLAAGADVKVAGVTVGHVASAKLDPVTYAAVVELRMDKDVKIPADSSAAVDSAGLLGGNYVGISPGGSDSMLKSGASFGVTQSAVNLEDLLGKFIFSVSDLGKQSAAKPASGAAPAAAPSAAAPAAAAPAAAAPSGAPSPAPSVPAPK